MKRYLLPIVALLVVAAVVPAGAVRIANTPITHGCATVYQAYPGNSIGQVSFLGYNGVGADPITAVPGVLWIVPGVNWANFVAAAKAGDAYSLKDTQLKKVVPTSNQCLDVFPEKTIIQQGTANIRTWWPLMYEKPGTKWTLTILWGTTTAKQYPGEPDKAWVHQDVWCWEVGVTEDSLLNLIKLFHELPYGKDEVPLISDEPLYIDLLAKVQAVKDAVGNAAKATALGELELLVSDHCIYTSPTAPFPSGLGRGLGIANSEENPACCKILVDAGALLAVYGAPGK